MKVDLSVITDAVVSLKSAADITRGMKDLNDLPSIRIRVIEIQELILNAQSSTVSAQAQLMGVMQENIELRARADAVDEWARLAARYRLVDYGDNTLAYELRPEAA